MVANGYKNATFTATAHISELARALDRRRIVGSGDENGWNRELTLKCK